MAPTICIVVDKVEIISVVDSTEMSLSHSKTNAVREALSKRTSSDLNAWMQMPVRI